MINAQQDLIKLVLWAKFLKLHFNVTSSIDFSLVFNTGVTSSETFDGNDSAIHFRAINYHIKI